MIAAAQRGIREQVNVAITNRLKSMLPNVQIENVIAPRGKQQSANMFFFFDSCQAEEPETIDPEEGFTQRQILLYRCNLRVAALKGDDRAAAFVDQIQEALMGFQVLPRRRDDEGFLFLVSDESVELEDGILLHSVVVGLYHYNHFFPDR